jgi:hypothetical protein
MHSQVSNAMQQIAQAGEQLWRLRRADKHRERIAQGAMQRIEHDAPARRRDIRKEVQQLREVQIRRIVRIEFVGQR